MVACRAPTLKFPQQRALSCLPLALGDRKHGCFRLPPIFGGAAEQEQSFAGVTIPNAVFVLAGCFGTARLRSEGEFFRCGTLHSVQYR